MRSCLLCICLLVGCTKVKEVTGFGPTQEEVAAQKEREQQQLKDADALVSKWADKVAADATDGGFKKAEGLTEIDPWGQPIKVTYQQEWFKEIATIRCAGPDGRYDTTDDLTRTRTSSNTMGVFSGVSPLGWIVILWVGCGLLALLFSAGVSHRRVTRGKSKRHSHPVIFFMATMVLAPLAAIIYGLQFVGGVLGADGAFFDGFDFDGGGIDIDLDIDL